MPVVALVLGAALVASILVVVPYLSLNMPTTPMRIFALDPTKYYGRSVFDEPITMKAVKVSDLRPNSFLWFLDPYGKTMQKLGDNAKTVITLNNKQSEELFQSRDAYENYMLIRLPEWIGGEKSDVSALRAYHAISLSDKCIHRYFADDGRWRMENPCAGDLYRPWDGYAFAGPASMGSVGFVPSRGTYPALQKMRLGTDSEGYVIAFRPDIDPRADGSQGEGRRLSQSDLEESNRAMIAAESDYLGYALPFPASLQRYHLVELNPAGGPWQVALSGPSGPREAIYNSDSEYRRLAMDVFSLRQFPDMALGGLIARASESGYAINNTLVNSLIHLDYYNQAPEGLIQTKNGTDIAGDYAILVAPSRLEGEGNIGAGALVWGKSADDKLDILVAINARDVTMDELVEIIKSLNMGA